MSPSTTAPPLGRAAQAGTTRRDGFAQRERATLEILDQLRDRRGPAAERARLRARAVALNLPMANRLARGYRHRGETLADLTQVAAMALVKAVDGYDPAKGMNFTGYATPTILGELRRHFRDRVWSVHLPRRMQERCLEISRERAELTQQLGREPTTADLAAALDITDTDVRAADASGRAYQADSLNRPVGTDAGSCDRQDLLGGEDPALASLCDRITLRGVLDELPPQARRIVELYFFRDRSQTQIAAELGTSQMTVSRLLSQTLRVLRQRMTEQPQPEPHDGSSYDGDTCVTTSETTSGCVIVRVRGQLPDAAARHVRDALVNVAVVRRPRTVIVDLRHTREPSPMTVRALVDGHRACGHVGARLHVVNVPPRLYQALCGSSVTRLFPCRPLPAPADGAARANAGTAGGKEQTSPTRAGGHVSPPATPPAAAPTYHRHAPHRHAPHRHAPHRHAPHRGGNRPAARLEAPRRRRTTAPMSPPTIARSHVDPARPTAARRRAGPSPRSHPPITGRRGPPRSRAGPPTPVPGPGPPPATCPARMAAADSGLAVRDPTAATVPGRTPPDARSVGVPAGVSFSG